MTGELFARPTREIAPGAVHTPDWLSLEQQRWIVGQCREWAAGPVPIRAARLPTGHHMSVQTVCLGWHWQPYRYTREASDVNGAVVRPFPDWLVKLGRRATGDASYTPDAALVNHYDGAARMGMHQDKDEVSREPVVSLSIGDSCVFRFGNTDNRGQPYEDVELRSGDLFVFGGPSRLAYHGVPQIRPGTAPEGCGLETGRINITMRVTGLTGTAAGPSHGG